MQVAFVDGQTRRELDIQVNSPLATVADLASALDPGGDPNRTLLIGDRVVEPDLELRDAGLHEGAILTLRTTWAAGPVAPPPPTPLRELVTVNGLDAGRRFPLLPGQAVVGRSTDCPITLRDATVSKRHAVVTTTPDGAVSVVDLGSHNGTWVGPDPVMGEPRLLPDGARLRLGAVVAELRPPYDHDRYRSVDPLRHTNAAGTIPFNRPPRAAPPPPPPEIRVPKPPDTGGRSAGLTLITLMTPLLFAGAMWAITKQVEMLMFSALTPLMGVATAVDDKRKGKKTLRNDSARFAGELAEMKERLDRAAGEERRRWELIYPDPAEILRRVALPSTTLWERRPQHEDFLRLRIGRGDMAWPAPLQNRSTNAFSTTEEPAELTEAIAAGSVLRDAPVAVDLSAGNVLGIIGDRPAALRLARSLLCQAASLHGPADVPVMILTDGPYAADWDWAKWLPHVRDGSGSGRMLATTSELSTALVEARLREAPPADAYSRAPNPGQKQVGPTLLVVVDDESLTEGRKAPTRNLLRGDAGLVAGIVIASRHERLPALCTTVVDMTDPDGSAELSQPQEGRRVGGLLAAGLADDVARDCSRSLARFEDPELAIVGAGLPASIRLLPLLGMDECTPEQVLERWRAAGPDPHPAGPIGVSEDGVFAIDFVRDGPHALVGGTTGAGKSELLRTLVAGMAAQVDPDHLTFVLVDFKGGSAFDECSKLPHTVGMVTDLDEHLAERALRCLEAELKHRERVLRQAGATDLPDYLRKHPGGEPMPRLLVIIDEFATLKAELPDFIDALVGVAQRGRSLGVHMLLATQRPQGAINDNIRANTNLRVALRVQDKSDSNDIIDTGAAALIPRSAPGRAYVRLGHDETVAIQTALSTGARTDGAQAHVDVAPFVFGLAPREPGPGPAPGSDGDDPSATDLALLVEAIEGAFGRSGRPRPRRPWPDPLPPDLDLDAVIDQALRAAGDRELPNVPVAMADDPDAQAQYPTGWVPRDGNLIVYGIGGAGTTTTLTSLALALARLRSPEDVHMYALDFGAGELAELAALPHVGGVILSTEKERQTRLLRYLRTELDRRRELGASVVAKEPTLVVLVDGWSAFAAEYNDLGGGPIFEAFTRVFSDGPEVGILTLVAADRASAVPGNLASLVRQRLALRLADAYDYTAFGIKSAAVPEMISGRGLVAGTGQVVQVARPADGVAAAAMRVAAAWPAPARHPRPIDTLATEVPLASINEAAQLTTRPWHIPVGIAEHTLAPTSLVAYQGEHVLVGGSARSGKSTTLLTIAAVAKRDRPDVTVLAVAGPRSPLSGDALVDRVVPPSSIGEALEAAVGEPDGPVMVLIDDAEAIDDVGGVLERLSISDRPNLLVAAAGRNDGLRAAYSHWTRTLRRSKLGVLLQPNIDLDGDILGTALPRRAPVAMAAGRGYLVNSGDNVLVQVALPR